MFGYVTPCKMELKMKDFEKFKAYYCGLCHSIKKQYGNLPRASLNYDMTFLGILLDSLENNKCSFKKIRCAIHPIKDRLVILNNEALDYASFCNVTLAYYKLMDDVQDDNSLTGTLKSALLKKYITKSRIKYPHLNEYIEKSLKDLWITESSKTFASLDEVSHFFADLTGYIISSYIDNISINDKAIVKENLYWLGYNLGKWIYIIDAWDDLEKDLRENKFNPLNILFNNDMATFDVFASKIEQRIDFTLVTCASNCVEYLNNLPLSKNGDLLNNILQFGLMEKMDTVFKRSESEDAKSL
jgi:hypothetical protein